MTVVPSTSKSSDPLVNRDLTLTGRLDAAAVLALRVPVTEAVADGPAIVLIDVSGVTNVTASGVAGLLELLRLARLRGGDLRIHGTSQAVVDAQEAAHLTNINRVYAGRDEAVSAGPEPDPNAARRRHRHARPAPVDVGRRAKELNAYLQSFLDTLEPKAGSSVGAVADASTRTDGGKDR